jgi:malonate decarboxylase gamma subunit
MGKESAARITLRTVEALEKLAATIPPMAYDVSNYATLGLLSDLLDISNPDAPSIRSGAGENHAARGHQRRASGSHAENRLGAENRRSSRWCANAMKASW